MNKHDEDYQKRYDKMLQDVESLFDNAADNVSRATANAGIKPDDMFKLAAYPAIAKKISGIVSEFSARLTATIKTGITDVWNLSNTKNGEMLTGIFDTNIPKSYAVQNLDALQALTSGKSSGLSISERVWKIEGNMKGELERCINAALSEGKGAPELAREIKKYLKEPDMLFRRIRDKEGNLKLSQKALDYNPGRGVYRSSYQNALRLARTELNKAYRRADWLQWQNMDFVIGYRIVSSRSVGVCELCSSLEGPYPKDFYFTGWHPACRCHCESILATQDNSDIISGNYSTTQPPIPGAFSEWLKDNADKIAKSAPNFVAENMKYVKG